MISIKSEEEIKKIRAAGKILAKTLSEIRAVAEEGITLKDLDGLAYGLIKKAGGKPAFLGYKPYGALKPFPATICASVNEVVVHGVPTNRRLENGDLLKIDLGVVYEGYFADAAFTLIIGVASKLKEKLVAACEEALYAAVYEMKEGKTLGDIGFVIKRTVLRHGFKVIKGLTGHGIGKELHEDPSVFNEGKRGMGLKLKKGMVLAIEPMISMGNGNIKQLKDDSYATADGSLSAHFEHTVVVTENEPEILTVL